MKLGALLVKKYNEIIDLIVAKRREADDKLYELYNFMLSQGIPESLARKTADDMNRQAIEMYNKLIQENLIPVRDEFIEKYNLVTVS